MIILVLYKCITVMVVHHDAAVTAECLPILEKVKQALDVNNAVYVQMPYSMRPSVQCNISVVIVTL